MYTVHSRRYFWKCYAKNLHQTDSPVFSNSSFWKKCAHHFLPTNSNPAFDSQTGQNRPLCYFTLTNARQVYSDLICPFLFLNPFPPRPAKTSPFVILLCLTLKNFTCQDKGLIIGCTAAVNFLPVHGALIIVIISTFD